MSNIKAPLSLDILQTGDGSPTLSLSGGEKMHSMDGAYSETLYIYGEVMEMAFSQGQPHLLSMGLGLAYNEILATGLAIKHQLEGLKITSFEIVPELREYFQNWALQKEATPIDECYEWICEKIAKDIGTPVQTLRQRLKQSLETNDLCLMGAVTAKNPTSIKYNVILYDAFSNHTDPELWSQEHLDELIQNYCHPEFCLFTTYAATGNLKRALRAQGFEIEKRKGFSRKRESTFAVRKS